MEFLEGQRVVMTHTGNDGVISAVLSEDMVKVVLSDGFEIPVSVDDIKIYTTGESYENPKKKTAEKAASFHPKEIFSKTPVTNTGLLVGFETRYDYDGNPEKYRIYLINDTTRDVVFNFEMKLNSGNNIKLNGLSKTNSAFPLGHLLLDELNESPNLIFECWPTTTNGRDKQMNRSFKVKAKNFFKKVKTTPILKGETHLYELINHLPSLAELEKKEETLEEYTKRVAETHKKDDLLEQYYTIYNIKQKADFNDVLDLHIEKLVENPAKLNNVEKLHFQIESFEQYIEEAVRVGFERVFIIHGLGKGRLRDIIASRLIRNEYVDTFKNDYHPKFGFGATEVILKK
ncbi:MAG: Smr/MutS family protein [Saprospiraceae bacterium]